MYEVKGLNTVISDINQDSNAWYPMIAERYFPEYYRNYNKDKSKFEQAFKIAEKLFELEIMNPKIISVREFIKIINEIAEVI